MPDRVAIVGSRRRTDRETVERAVAELPGDAIVVSGGCHGVDTWAELAARVRGLDVLVLRPDTSGVRSRGEVARRYHARNQRIVDNSDRVIAFPALDGIGGGTEDTIARALKAGKPVALR